jgi:hypothetical protein
MKIYKTIIMFVVLLALVLPVQSARADVAPPVEPFLAGLEPFKYEDTHVQMLYERVELELQPFHNFEYDSSGNHINVTANFVMRNRGNETESMQAIFPMGSLKDCAYLHDSNSYSESTSYTEYSIKNDSFEIFIDGTPVATKIVTTSHPYKNIYPECETMDWIGFDVTFPVNIDVVIIVKYVMDADYTDYMQNLSYVLETGAGWYGPIERAYVIFKLPYAVDDEMFLEATTPGFQKLYNEIFWSFQNLEPTSKDNIQVLFVSPDTWQFIQNAKRHIRENPANPEIWLDLVNIYQRIAYYHGPNVRSTYYVGKIAQTYESGIAANPYSAGLHASYADYLLFDCCYYFDMLGPTTEELILSHINKALASDPHNSLAIQSLGTLTQMRPYLSFNYPPTNPPMVTSVINSTPTETPLPTVTPKTGEIQKVVTVIQTKIVTATPKELTSTLTYTQTPTLTLIPMPEAIQNNSKVSVSNWVMWPLLLIAGGAAGVFISKKKWI